jgi:hypothetical protein
MTFAAKILKMAFTLIQDSRRDERWEKPSCGALHYRRLIVVDSR